VRPPNAKKETGIPRDGRTTCITCDSEGSIVSCDGCPESVEGCDGRGCEEEHPSMPPLGV